jgi:hemoglobin-like flavoprotein
MMTPEHEALVRSTWAAAAPRAAAMVDRFYAELFERSPESRALFDRVDREALARKFQLTLGEIVAVLDDPERLVTVLGPLGRHHAGPGVRSGHHEVALGALISALRETCGEVFTAAAEEAWRELYNLVASVMKRGDRVIPLTIAG